MQIFKRSDVEELAARVKTGLRGPVGASRPGSQLAVKNGKLIMRTKAMKEYKVPAPSLFSGPTLNDCCQLKAVHLEEIFPVTTQPNPHGTGGDMRHYNVVDVELLANKVHPGGVPGRDGSGSKAVPKRRRPAAKKQDRDGPLAALGLSVEDAAAIFRAMSGDEV